MKYNFNKVLMLSFLVIGTLTMGDTSLQAQNITTIAGNGVQGYSSDGIPATSAELNYPIGVAVDDSGNIYIGDWENNRVRKVTISTGDITTIAGNGTPGYSGDGAAATSAELYYPQDVALDDSGNLYIADLYNSRIRKVTASTGIISTIAGTGFGAPFSGGYSGDGGPATAAELYQAYGVVVDHSGNVFIADSWNNRVRKITKSTGIITTVAGDSLQGYAGDGGQSTNAELYMPYSLAVDDSGDIYISDSFNNRIRKVNAKTGIITTIAGNGTQGYSGDGGAATSAELYHPYGVAVDSVGNVYFSDPYNSHIRVVSGYTGIVTTYAGNGTQGYSGDGIPATSAELNTPGAVAVNGCGNVYIADMYNNRIRKVVNITPVVTASPNPALICNGNSTILKATGAVAYFWTPATGLSSTTDTIVTANPTVTTTYTLEGVDNTGCAGTTKLTVIVDTSHVLDVHPQSPIICNGQSVILNVTDSGTNFTWLPSAGLNNTIGDTVLAAPTITTVYSVSGNDSMGCLATGMDTVKVKPALPLNIEPLDTLFCSGQSATLYVSSGGSSFSWIPSTGLSADTGTFVVASPTLSTTYIVTGLNSNGCADTGTDKVIVVPSPNKPTFYQHGDTLISSSKYDNQWYLNGNMLNNDTSQNLIITSTGKYWVNVVNEANGCSTTSDTITIDTVNGINRLTAISDQISIYPNPFTNEIYVKINSSEQNIKDWRIQITDVLGRTIYSMSFLNYNNNIDRSSLSSGMYFITVINKTDRAVFPVVKQNY